MPLILEGSNDELFQIGPRIEMTQGPCVRRPAQKWRKMAATPIVVDRNRTVLSSSPLVPISDPRPYHFSALSERAVYFTILYPPLFFFR
jgi:hypothetical protein